jgi:hypothetical protein
MGETSYEWQPPVAAAWRDGDELVIRAGAPLPPICVFCGAPAVAGIRTAINTRGHPLGNLQAVGIRIPVCDDDRRRNRSQLTRRNLTVIVGFVLLLLGGTVPGSRGLVTGAMNPFGGTLPTVRTVVLAIAVFFGIRGARRLLQGSRRTPRPVTLRFDRSQDGFIWLRGADARCLSQLPPVAPGR